VLTIIFFTLSACNTAPELIGPTPDVPDVGARPYYRSGNPSPWDCSEITKVSPGLTWRGLQIGVTTFDEMVEILQPHRLYRTQTLNKVIFQLEEKTWSDLGEVVGACFLGNVLSTLEIYWSRDDFPSHMEGLHSVYGKRDRVTWGYSAATRTMIWADDGLLVIVERIMGGDMDGELVYWSYILFPPIDPEKLDNSWLMRSISEPRSYLDSLANMPPEWQVEDPWRYSDD
ncbi:MAG: hypothetical protein OEV06_06485, partial [Anaerolineae bacterium]|nr:hypothetical protein [Anaerolineae bacterium]